MLDWRICFYWGKSSCWGKINLKGINFEFFEGNSCKSQSKEQPAARKFGFVQVCEKRLMMKMPLKKQVILVQLLAWIHVHSAFCWCLWNTLDTTNPNEYWNVWINFMLTLNFFGVYNVNSCNFGITQNKELSCMFFNNESLPFLCLRKRACLRRLGCHQPVDDRMKKQKMVSKCWST